MNDLDSSVRLVIIIVYLGFMALVGAGIGQSVQRHSILSMYCESQSAQYEVVDGVDYCLQDNQLTVIEWMK